MGPSSDLRDSALQILSDRPSDLAARYRILDTEQVALDTKFFARRIRNDEHRAAYVIPRGKY